MVAIIVESFVKNVHFVTETLEIKPRKKNDNLKLQSFTNQYMTLKRLAFKNIVEKLTLFTFSLKASIHLQTRSIIDAFINL